MEPWDLLVHHHWKLDWANHDNGTATDWYRLTQKKENVAYKKHERGESET